MNETMAAQAPRALSLLRIIMGLMIIQHGMAKLIGNQPFHGLRYEGRRFDCGDKIGFLEAQIAYALKRPELEDAVRTFLRRYVETPDFLVNAVSRETV